MLFFHELNFGYRKILNPSSYVLVAFFALGIWIFVPREVETNLDPQKIAGLTVSNSNLNLGEVWEENKFTWTLPIQNQSDEEVIISQFAVSCGCCQSIEPSSLSIPAKKTATITLKFDLTRRTHLELGQPRRLFSVTITPILKDKEPPSVGWHLHGVIKSRITLNTLAVHFGESIINGQHSNPQKVKATLHEPNLRPIANMDSNIGKIKIKPVVNCPGKWDVLIIPNPDLNPGYFSSVVKLKLINNKGEILPGIHLPIAGHVQPEVRVLPAQLFLGSLPFGEKAESVVVLQAPSDAVIKVERIEVDTRDLQIKAINVPGIPDGRAHQLTLRVLKQGEQTTKARFYIRSGEKGSVQLQMIISYNGQASNNTKEEK